MAAPPVIPPADPLRDLAARIYVELVCHDNAAQAGSKPEELARISFKLADAFQKVNAELKAPSMPKNQEFDMRAASLPGFGTPG